MQKGLVSIITPMYNAEKYIADTIKSVLAQTYSQWEMIIVNDGSKDECERIASEFARKDTRIKVFSQQNRGSASARNNGIRRAAGQYIALLDADDLWEPYFLELQLSHMNDKKALLVYGSHKRIDADGRECLIPFIAPSKITYKDLLKTCSISCLTALYDTSDYGKFYLDEKLKSLRDDHLYWLTIIKHTGVAYGNKKIIASYRLLGNSVTSNKKKMIVPQFKVYYKYEKLGLFRSLYYLANWALRGYLKYRK
ncbi:MAG: glycosyltransferase family 2 protein [Tannerellaceae bacterium]|jgi:glycosyltransferase involved in cell wall biosynthesis|nr:glycosyltransferase family 2 protein [Tannerellaceae bacterium]